MTEKKITGARFSELLDLYLSISPDNCTRLSRDLHVQEETLKKWGESSLFGPHEDDRVRIMEKIDKFVAKDFKHSVISYICYKEGGAKSLARHHEVAVSTVARWARGTSVPMFRMRCEFMIRMLKDE